jgi:hypothetical protein
MIKILKTIKNFFKNKKDLIKEFEDLKEKLKMLENDNKYLISVVSQLDVKIMPFLQLKDLQMWKTANGGDKLIKMNYFEKAIKQMEAICSDYSNQKALFQFLRMTTSQLMDEVKARDFILCCFTALGYADNIPKLEQDFTEHKIAKNLEVREKHNVSIF